MSGGLVVNHTKEGCKNPYAVQVVIGRRVLRTFMKSINQDLKD